MRLILAIVAATYASASAEADETTVPYNQAPGTCSAPIAVPANNKPVTLTGTMITKGFEGEGHATLLRTTGTNQLLSWEGSDFHTSREVGFTKVSGAVIISTDYLGDVTVQSSASAHLQVCVATGSLGGAHGIGYLTFTY